LHSSIAHSTDAVNESFFFLPGILSGAHVGKHYSEFSIALP